ncbi:MAG: c-type cytochrome domain-containing protein [Pirellula sp.]
MRIRSRWNAWTRVYLTGAAIVSAFGIALSGGAAQAQSMESAASAVELPPAVRYDAVQPILREHCAACHNEDQPRADLVLTSLDKILAGSASGPVVVPGQPQASPLYLLTAHLESPRMPPNKPRLSPRELNKLSQWIETGLVLEAAPAGAMPEATNVTPASEPNRSDPLSLKPLRECVPTHRVRAIAIHPNAPKMAIDGDEQVILWDLESDSPEASTIESSGEEISQLQFNSDGSQLWIATGVPADYGQVHLWDVATSNWKKTYGSESDTIQALAIAPAHDWLAIGTSSKQLKLLEYPAGPTAAPEIALEKHTDWVTATAISPDGLLVASGDRFGAVILWDPVERKEFATLRGHTRGITSIAWAANGERLCTSSQDGTLRWWDLHRLESIRTWPAHEGGVSAMVMAPSGYLVTAGRDGAMKCWSLNDVESGQPTFLWQQNLGAPAIALGLGNHGKSLAVSNALGQIRVATWQPDTDMSRLPGFRTLVLPTQPRMRSLIAAAPKPPNRALPESMAVESSSRSERVASQPLPTTSDSTSSATSVQKGAAQEIPAMLPTVTVANRDLEELRQTLRVTQEALDRSYETTKQLEEAVARLEAVLAIQEARAKQAELDLRRSKTLPKTP